MITIDDLKLKYQKRLYYIDNCEVDYRTGNDPIILEETPAGVLICKGVYYTKGIACANPHYLSVVDKHDGLYKTPYFEYKYGTRFDSIEEALKAYNQWLQHKDENKIRGTLRCYFSAYGPNLLANVMPL